MPKSLGKSAKRAMEVVQEDESNGTSTASQPHDTNLEDEDADEKYIPPINKIIE